MIPALQNAVDTAPVYDVNIIGSQPVTAYWSSTGKGMGPVTLGFAFDSKHSDAVTVRGGYNQTGIYARGGITTLGAANNSFLYLHELTHYVQNASQTGNLDLDLATSLGLAVPSPTDATKVISAFFNSKCQKAGTK